MRKLWLGQRLFPPIVFNRQSETEMELDDSKFSQNNTEILDIGKYAQNFESVT